MKDSTCNKAFGTACGEGCLYRLAVSIGIVSDGVE